MPVCDRRQRGAAVGAGDDVVARVEQGFDRHRADHLIVVNQQDALHATVSGLRFAHGLGLRRFSTRQQHLDRRALFDDAADARGAAALAGETVGHRQPQSGALADRLGGEERLEHLVDDVGGDPGAVVGDGEADVVACIQVARLRQGDRPGRDRDASRALERIAGVDRQVQHHVVELVGIGDRDQRRLRQVQQQLDVLADRLAEQRRDGFDACADIERHRVERLLARECQHALGQRGRAQGRAHAQVHVARNALQALALQRSADHVERTDDAGEQIVEIVRDAAGQLAQRIHLQRLLQLDLGAFALGDLQRELAVGRVELAPVGLFACVLLGLVVDVQQADTPLLVRSDPPFGHAHAAGHLQRERATPAVVAAQGILQIGHRLIAEQCRERLHAGLGHQRLERGIGLAHFQIGRDRGDRRADVLEDLAKAGLARVQRLLGAAHAQQRAQRRHQHVAVDRMDQVGIRAGLETGDQVPGLDRCRRDVHHRQQGGARRGPQRADHVETAHVGQVDVQHQRVVAVRLQPRQTFGAGARLVHLAAVVLEHAADGVARGDIVVHHQHAISRRHRAPPRRA